VLQEMFRKPDGKRFHSIFHVTSITLYCNYVNGRGPYSLAPNKECLLPPHACKGRGIRRWRF
jgi:hypothetical protein